MENLRLLPGTYGAWAAVRVLLLAAAAAAAWEAAAVAP